MTEISNTQLLKQIKDALKNHESMDGSGHLIFKERPNMTPELANDYLAYVYLELEKQGIPRSITQRLEQRTRELLYGLSIRGLPKQPKRQPKPKQPKQKQQKPQKQKQKQKQQRPQPQQPMPTLSISKSNARQEVRTIQVVVRKARNFHYPLDLPAGES